MARKPADLQSIEGETGHKYFHMMLNMADDDLDCHEYRLLGHYLRWAGHGGTHEEGIRQTAKVCHMGKSRVETTRDKLAEKGYLKIEKPTEDERKAGMPTKVTVIDRWSENVTRYGGVPNQVHPVPKQVHDAPKGVPSQVHPPVPKQVHIEERIEEPVKKSVGQGQDNVIKTDDQEWMRTLPGIHTVTARLANAKIKASNLAIATTVQKYGSELVLEGIDIAVMKDKRTWSFVVGCAKKSAEERAKQEAMPKPPPTMSPAIPDDPDRVELSREERIAWMEKETARVKAEVKAEKNASDERLDKPA